MDWNLGNHLEYALSSVGVTKERVTSWLGEDCGCAERQQKLNQLGQWARGVMVGKNSEANKQIDAILNDGQVTPVKEEIMKEVRWAYGVTTVPERRPNFLPYTLTSLRNAGFDKPRLFVDGTDDIISYQREFGLEVTVRNPKVSIFANWIMSLWELLIREPMANRYAIFQDDLLASRNLRSYLDKCLFQEKTYWNLYTFPHNQMIAPRTLLGGTVDGWFPSNQLGKGALALVFDRNGVTTLLQNNNIVTRPLEASSRAHKNVDGAILTALKSANYLELCHSPSLVQHTGQSAGTLCNAIHPLAESFRGENFDCMELLKCQSSTPAE